MKNCLASGFPFTFGFSVYQSFETKEVAQTGIVPLPQPNETLLGGHCVVAVGYDDEKQLFKCRNSWGTDWGDKGYFYMPYQYMSNPNLVSDLWTIQIMEESDK
jgi:C1A family cysteine protease